MSHRRSIFTLLAALLLACALASAGMAAGQIPPKPAQYVTDRAGIIDPATAAQLNHRLANFERETSNQLLVAIFPKVPEGFEREDFTVKAAHAWGIGQHGKNNGAVLFVFVNEHYVRIEVGYGLEPVLTDATCATIIRNDIVPAFRRQNYAAGINSAVGDMMLACRGEYHGTGKTHAESRSPSPQSSSNWFVGIFVLILLFFGWLSRRRRRYYGSSYGRTWNSGGPGWYVGGGGFDSGSSSSSSSNDSFSSGGGDFGGGGAGGSW
jgi:uncharacterized protein